MDRFDWALKIMQVRPKDCVLEIGCGDGRLIERMKDQVPNLKVVAIDKSATAVRRAKKRLTAFSNLKIKACPLKPDAFDEKFDRIVAFNVNLFWLDSEGKEDEYETLRKSLAKSGRLFIFFQTPQRARDAEILKVLRSNFRANRFEVIKVVKDQASGSFGLVLKKS